MKATDVVNISKRREPAVVPGESLGFPTVGLGAVRNLIFLLERVSNINDLDSSAPLRADF